MILQEIKKMGAYRFDTSEWLYTTSTMNAVEKGIFFELLFYYKRNGSLPEEITRLAKVVRAEMSEFIPVWKNICHHFEGMLKPRRQSEWITPPKWNGSYYDIEERPGVYAIRAFLGNPKLRRPVVYVGEAKNLHSRLSSHEIDKLLNENGIYSCCKIKYCDNRKEQESVLIRKIKPIFNMQHNKEFVRNVLFNHGIGVLQNKMEENIS